MATTGTEKRAIRPAIVATMTVALVVLLLAWPWLGATTLTLQVVAFALINVIVVQGLTVLYGYADQVSLATGAFFGFGAYVTAIGSVTFGLNLYVATAVAVVLSWVLGLVVGLPALRLKGHYLAMGTLAFSALMVLFFTEAQRYTGGVDGFGNIGFVALPGVGESYGRVATMYLVSVVVAVLAVWVTRSVVRGVPGDCLRAMAASENGARACGVVVEEVKVRAFGYSAAAAGLGGALYAMLVGFISPSLLGVSMSITFVAMSVIGGRKSIVGPIVAAVALTAIQQLNLLMPGMDYAVAEAVKSVQIEVYALAIIALTLFAPAGLPGLLPRRRGADSGPGGPASDHPTDATAGEVR